MIGDTQKQIEHVMWKKKKSKHKLIQANQTKIE
jgi:hypothetical protein